MAHHPNCAANVEHFPRLSCDCPGWYFFTEQSSALNAHQLHAIRLGALKTYADKWRSMGPGPNKDRWKSMIDALHMTSIVCRVIGQDGSSNGDIVLFEANGKPGRGVFSFGAS